MKPFRSFFAGAGAGGGTLRGRFVIHTRNPFADQSYGLPGAIPDRFFLSELDTLWLRDRAEATRIVREYRAAGFNSTTVGPVVRGGYHGHFPATDWRGDADGFVAFVRWLVGEGITPRLYLWPDVPEYFAGTGKGWHWDRIERDIVPLYDRADLRALIGHTRNAWEEYASIANMRPGFERQVALFPAARNLYHNMPGHLGPGNSDEDEGECHRSMLAAGMDGLALQTAKPLDFGPYGALNADGRSAAYVHAYDVWDIGRRYHRTDKPWVDGTPATRVWGDLRTRRGERPHLDWEEGCAHSDYWSGFTGAYDEYTRLALEYGAENVLDGLPL